MTALAMIRAAIEHGPHAELLAQVNAEVQATCAAEEIADEHLAVFIALVDVASPRKDAYEQGERQAIVERFGQVQRANYIGVWRRAGQPFGTRLWRAMGWELRARESDQLFVDAVAAGAIPGIPDGRFIKRPIGLAVLLRHVEEDWRQAHLRMLGQEQKDDLARARDDAREREWQAQQAAAV